MRRDRLAALFAKPANFLIYAIFVFMTCGMKPRVDCSKRGILLSRYNNSRYTIVGGL